MAAVLEGFRRLGATFTIEVPEGVPDDSQTYSFLSPLEFSSADPPPRGEYFSRVWAFDSETGSALAKSMSEKALEMIPWAPGAWDYFVLMLSEMLDNVIEHSSTTLGFVEVQIHRSGTVLMTVADYGVGIRQSFLRTNMHSPRTDQDALLLAINEKITSLPDRGRGNGLWFATRNAAANNGQFSLFSGLARVVWQRGAREPSIHDVRRFIVRGLPYPAPMTVASLDFDGTRELDSIKVLGYEPIIPEREQYERGAEIALSVAKQSRGTATRTGHSYTETPHVRQQRCPAIQEHRWRHCTIRVGTRTCLLRSTSLIPDPPKESARGAEVGCSAVAGTMGFVKSRHSHREQSR